MHCEYQRVLFKRISNSKINSEIYIEISNEKLTNKKKKMEGEKEMTSLTTIDVDEKQGKPL